MLQDLFTVGFDTRRNKLSCALAVFVDVFPEAVVGDIHLSQGFENVVGAGVEVVCNTLLQFFDRDFCRLAVRGNAGAVQLGKLFKHRVEQGGSLAAVCMALLELFVGGGIAPTLFGYLCVLTFLNFVFVFRFHKTLSFLHSVDRHDQLLQPFFFHKQ